MISTLPPILRPPSDPTWVPLGGRNGWRAERLEGVVVSLERDVLELARGSESTLFHEPTHTLGGRVAPSCVAFDAQGNVYLQPLGSRELWVFDGCECAFRRLTCPGPATGPRALGAGALAAGDGLLYSAHAAAGHVTVFGLPELELRGFLRAPEPWQPVDVAVGRHGRIWVADPVQGGVHRFDRHGRWLGVTTGLGDVRRVAVDSHGHVHVGALGSDAGGQPITVRTRLDAHGAVLAGSASEATFPRLPFQIHPGSWLQLEPRGGCTDRPCVFGLNGVRVDLPAGWHAAPWPWLANGTYRSEALDSRLPGCLWHRLVVQARAGDGARIELATTTSDVELSSAALDALPASAWSTLPALTGLDGAWEGLILSATGRYLWLRATLRGPGTATPCIRGIDVEYPRIRMGRFLPAVFSEEPTSRDFLDRFLAVFDTTLRSIGARLDQQAALFDLRSSPASSRENRDMLGWLGGWVGLSAPRSWPEERRRRFLQGALANAARRGTTQSIQALIAAHIGMDRAQSACDPRPPDRCCVPRDACERAVAGARAWERPPLVLEHFRLRRWLHVGSARLGDCAVLWGESIVNRSQLDANARIGRTRLDAVPDPKRDPFHVYAHAFTAFVPANTVRSERACRELQRLLRAEAPAHVRFELRAVEPRMRVGTQSVIGLDSVVGRYPEGVVLGVSPLDRGQVLGPRGADAGRMPMRIGERAQIGTTTALK